MKAFLKLLFVILLIIPFLISCEDDKRHIGSEDSIYIFIDEVMHSFYLWNEEVPALDIFNYSHPSDLLEDLKYKPLDKWSYMDYADVIEAYFEEGEYFGFGFYPRFDDTGNLRVIIIYEDCDAYKQGIRKGDIIKMIDGVDPRYYNDFEKLFDDSPQQISFTFERMNNATINLALSKTTVIQNGVFYTEIYSVDGVDVGYIVYDSFLGNTKSELEEAIGTFKTLGIDELIIDLRYNGGGYGYIAKEFAEMVIPSEKVGEVFSSKVHNEIIGPELDTTDYLAEHQLNLDLERVFFITSQFSASASELLINCLEPHMEVIIIGSRTSGKPVGMYGLPFQEWIVLPVMVKTVNSLGFGDYYDGISVDAPAGEGTDKAWGDSSDPNLEQAFNFINSGSFLVQKSMKSFVYNEKLRLPDRRNMLIYKP